MPDDPYYSSVAEEDPANQGRAAPRPTPDPLNQNDDGRGNLERRNSVKIDSMVEASKEKRKTQIGSGIAVVGLLVAIVLGAAGLHIVGKMATQIEEMQLATSNNRNITTQLASLQDSYASLQAEHTSSQAAHTSMLTSHAADIQGLQDQVAALQKYLSTTSTTTTTTTTTTATTTTTSSSSSTATTTTTKPVLLSDFQLVKQSRCDTSACSGSVTFLVASELASRGGGSAKTLSLTVAAYGDFHMSQHTIEVMSGNTSLGVCRGGSCHAGETTYKTCIDNADVTSTYNEGIGQLIVGWGASGSMNNGGLSCDVVHFQASLFITYTHY